MSRTIQELIAAHGLAAERAYVAATGPNETLLELAGEAIVAAFGRGYATHGEAEALIAELADAAKSGPPTRLVEARNRLYVTLTGSP